MAIVISGVNNNDKITASDGTIDLLSGVSYASTITAPAFTTPGSLTAGHLNIGSGIQLGNAGIITATTLIGNVTGNVNHTSNLLLQISGSEKFRVGTSGQFGIAGANYGTSGQVLTSGGSGSAPTWSTISVPPATTINNNAGNKVITGSSTANTLDAEDTLRYDGTNFLIGTNTEAPYSNRNLTVAAGGSGSTTVAIEIRSPSNGTGRVIFSDGTSADSSANEGQVIYQQSDHKMLFGVAANYQNMALESTGGTGADLNLIDGNLKFASGHGIDFSSASGSASGSASALMDDYEEGTWSPLWSNSAANSGGTTTSNNMYGKYTKIGRIVHAYFYTNGLPTGNSGSMYLQGFPFQCASNPGAFFGAVQSAFYNFGADNYYNLGLRLSTNRTFAELIFCRKDPGNYVAANFNGFINYYTNFVGTITYEVA